MPFINRCGDAPKLQTKTVNPLVTQQIITPDDGYDGLEQVTVNAPVFQTKTVTTDGTFTPDNGYVGINQMIVNTPCNVYVSVSDSPVMDPNRPNTVDTTKRIFFIGDMMVEHASLPDIIMLFMDRTKRTDETPPITTLFAISSNHTLANGLPTADWTCKVLRSDSVEQSYGFLQYLDDNSDVKVNFVQNNSYLEIMIPFGNGHGFSDATTSPETYIGYFIWGLINQGGDA